MEKVVLSIFAGLMMFGTNASAQQQDVCKQQVAERLGDAGLKWDDLTNIQWDVDSWVQGDNDNPDISGYQFYARPLTCASGSIVVEMDQDCLISDVYARNGCSVPGLK